jgi:DNA-binding GntR family transcriptional regulator
MSDPGPEVTSKSLIYKEIRRSIIVGRCQPGERLSIENLAEKYGTSVTPVRDALQMLSQEGLVTIKPRSGYFVTRMTLKELRDLLEMREILETAGIERAVGRITEDMLVQLEHIHSGYTGDDDESYDRYTDENRRFHYLLAAASGNSELAEAVGRLHDRLARFMVLRHAGHEMAENHGRIVQALRRRDGQAARTALLNELVDTRQRVLERVIQEEGAAWLLAAPEAGR